MNAISPADSFLGRYAAPADAPNAFIPLQQRMHPWLDRKLGYFGNARFVCFYYEPRGEEVIWKDGRSYGFASGGWSCFADDIAPLADRHQVALGHTGTPARQVLLIDRTERAGYFIDRPVAEQLLRQQA
jgi:hypothetical protein